MTLTDPTTFAPGALEMLELEEALDADLACEALRVGQCPNPAAWVSTCPACGMQWAWCEKCHATIDRRARAIPDASATHDGKQGCGKTFPYSALTWRPI